MKLYNMRNNEELGPFDEKLLAFLSKYLLKEGESDEDFFVHFDNLKVLKKNAKGEEEKELVTILKETLEKEVGQSGIDIYYE
ncbi:MAG: hypothetical protein IEMM0008_0483 [bacterium]|nr:MAG: hypothetical protein IEMM0008_0483 [bacterium]